MVRIAPQPGGLSWAAGGVPTPRGVVQCAWQIGPDGPLAKGTAGWSVRVALPDERLEADIELPARGKLTVLAGKVNRRTRRGGKLILRCTGSEIRLHVG